MEEPTIQDDAPLFDADMPEDPKVHPDSPKDANNFGGSESDEISRNGHTDEAMKQASSDGDDVLNERDVTSNHSDVVDAEDVSVDITDQETEPEQIDSEPDVSPGPVEEPDEPVSEPEVCPGPVDEPDDSVPELAVCPGPIEPIMEPIDISDEPVPESPVPEANTSPNNDLIVPPKENDNTSKSNEDTPASVHAVNKSAKSARVQELESRVSELELTLKDKDETITTLKTEVDRLNTEIKSRSVPTAKKPGDAKADPKSKTVGAKKTSATRPASGAKAVARPMANGVGAKKPAAQSPRKPAAVARPKTAPAKSTGAKKPGKTPTRTEIVKGADGEEHAVKLFLRGRGVVCYPPTDFTLDDVKSEKPEESLKINWVYGYRGRDSQDNIYCLPSNELLYFQAALGVIYNPATKTQRFYQGHNDDIKCIALNPINQSIVATGQTAGHDEKEGDPHVRVWNCETLETLAILGMGQLQRGVGSVSFSPDGSKLLLVDEGNDHTIYVYDWNKKTKLTSQKGHQDPVLGAEFIPTSNSRFITYGKGHIIFWEIEGNKLVKKSGLFEKHAKPRFITSLAFTSKGEPISGDSSGNVYLWNPAERKIAKSKTGAHEGTVYSIAVRGEDFYTGGQDCMIKKFSVAGLTEEDSWQLDAATHGRVKAITFCGDSLAVGTYNNGMLFGAFGEEPEQIIYGHGAGDLWGGANHPSDNTFATVGQDKIVYIWDAETHNPKHIFKVEKPAQSCGFSPCGSVLGVASTTGEWWVLDANTGDLLSSYKSGPEQIDAISYSPDGTRIAVGSHDNFVYLFECEDLRSEYKPVGRCTGHSSFITHLDFSDDGKVLQTTSGDYEHLFWETETGDQITNTKDLRDVNMATYTCTLGFPVCGIWPVGYDGTDINSVCRSHDSKLVATADDFGLVNLFRYPCCNPTAEWSSFRGHSAHVTKVRFLNSDKEIISLGGRDQSIIQWGIC